MTEYQGKHRPSPSSVIVYLKTRNLLFWGALILGGILSISTLILNKQTIKTMISR